MAGPGVPALPTGLTLTGNCFGITLIGLVCWVGIWGVGRIGFPVGSVGVAIVEGDCVFGGKRIGPTLRDGRTFFGGWEEKEPMDRRERRETLAESTGLSPRTSAPVQLTDATSTSANRPNAIACRVFMCCFCVFKLLLLLCVSGVIVWWLFVWCHS